MNFIYPSRSTHCNCHRDLFRRIRPHLLVLLLLILTVSGKSSEIDSLKKVIGSRQKANDRISSMFALGKAYYNASDYRNALETDRNLLELIRTDGNRADSAKAFRHIGLVLMEMSWYDESLNYLMQSQHLYKEMNDTLRQATCLMNIGIVHDMMGNLPMSLSYYNQALSFFKMVKDDPGIANCRLNIGILLTKQNKLDQAIEYFREAANIYSKTNNQAYLAASYLNMGLAFKRQKLFDEAMDFHTRSYEIYRQLNDRYHICFFHLNMGELLMQMNRIAEAKPHLDSARVLAGEMGVMDLSVKAYEFLSDYYVRKRNYEEAYNCLLHSKQLNDSILNAETLKKVSQVQYQYEIAKRESEKNRLIHENMRNEWKLSTRTTILYVVTGILILIILYTILLYLWYRSKHKANQELEARNKLIEAQKDELIKLNASKDKFLSILAHDIKNPLSAILGFSDILSSDYQDLSDEERINFSRDIFTSASNLFEIVNTLLNWSISQNGLISYQPKNFSIGELCQGSVNKLQPIAKLKDISLSVSLDDDLVVFADDNMIQSVVHNLLSNAIKYSFRGGNIMLKTMQKDSIAEISIIDEGTGISRDDLVKLFRYDQSFRSRGTAGELGTGIGLLLCKDFVERNLGTISVESETNKGSIFTFTLPLAKS